MSYKAGFSTYRPSLSGNVESLAVLYQQLELELQRIAATFDQLAGGIVLTPATAEPTKLKPLMLVYADGSNWDPGSGEGVYVRNLANAAWVKL